MHYWPARRTGEALLELSRQTGLIAETVPATILVLQRN